MVEILVTMTIMLTLAATAQMYYGAILPEQKIGRAKTDIQQYKKAVGYLKSNYKPGALTSDVFRYYEDGPPWPASPGPTPYSTSEDLTSDPGLEKLLKYQIVPALTADPWGGGYRVSVQRGVIYSSGPDGVPLTEDDIADSYQPDFVPLRARLTAGGQYLDVEFSRELSRQVKDLQGAVLSRVSTSNFSVDPPGVEPCSQPVAAIVTATIDFSSPFVVRLRLRSTTLPQAVTVRRSVPSGMRCGDSGNLLRSADGALLSTDKVELRTSAVSGLYVASE